MPVEKGTLKRRGKKEAVGPPIKVKKRSVAPVSYTHLDVYKRQAQWQAVWDENDTKSQTPNIGKCLDSMGARLVFDQVLSGHGAFKVYLRRPGKIENDT